MSPIRPRRYSLTPDSPASTYNTADLPGELDYQPSEVDMDDLPEPNDDNKRLPSEIHIVDLSEPSEDDEKLVRRKIPTDCILIDVPQPSDDQKRTTKRRKMATDPNQIKPDTES